MSNIVECFFCGMLCTENHAIERGWIPSFFPPGDELEKFEPVCPACCGSYLKLDPEIQGFVQVRMPSP
jgi:hypothetical protein